MKYVQKIRRRKMTRDEYNLLFHTEQLNLVAFKRLMDCDEEVLRLVNKAIAQEREACAKVCESYLSESPYSWGGTTMAEAIRARGTT
jgi:hypothetical protein